MSAGSTSTSHACCRAHTSQVIRWGDEGISGYTPPADAAKDVVSIACSDELCGAVRRDGRVVVWGYNDTSDPVDGVPVEVQDGMARSIAVGGAHVLVLRADGAVIAWGSDEFGQTTLPEDVAGGQVVGIAAGRWHSLAVLATGEVRAWGSNQSEQRLEPDAVLGIKTLRVGSGWTASFALAAPPRQVPSGRGGTAASGAKSGP